MKPEGRKHCSYSHNAMHIKKKDGQGWWTEVCTPNKARAKREANKEIQKQLKETNREESK